MIKNKIRKLSPPPPVHVFSIQFQPFDGTNDNALQEIPLDIYR